MDTNKKSTHLKNSTSLPPAQLWIGNHETLVKRTKKLLQDLFCTQQRCSTCTTCRQIGNQQHHAIMWLYPEKQYTLDQLDTILNTISFALNPGQHYFFVLQKADFLTAACANSLLKPIEEPPQGYHFILLAQRSEQVLPTVRSRCIITSFTQHVDSTVHADLFAYFTSTQFVDPNAFLKQLDQSNVNERESIELIDALLNYWIQEYKKATQNGRRKQIKEKEQMLATIKKAAEQPPMPGSSKIFWKNLFLQLKTF